MLDLIQFLEKDSQQKRIVSSKVVSRPKNRNKLEITCRNLTVDLFLFQNRSMVRLKTALRTKDETGRAFEKRSRGEAGIGVTLVTGGDSRAKSRLAN